MVFDCETGCLFQLFMKRLICSGLIGGICERYLPGQSHLNCWNDRRRTLLQDGDNSGNDPPLVPGFSRRCSGMFPVRFRRVSVLAGSREIRLI